jgi:hypothetical protein
MLQLLVRVYERLEPRFDGYKAKLQIIEKNIYGVDIEPMAVEIARLRTWLSIIVDEESDSKKIKPLPNLEFKFVCANSLIDLDQSGSNAFGDDPNLESKLRDIRDAYFNTESLNKKKKLRNDYDALVNTGPNMFGESEKSLQLKTYRPFDNESSASFFNPEFMFGVNNFGILIANPPYIDSEGMVKSGQSALREQIQKKYKWTKGNWDIYIAFFELGFRYTDEHGVLSYITPDKWISKPFGDELRKGIIDNIFLVLKSGRKIFDSAKVDSIITFLSKKVHKDIKIVEYKEEKFVEKKIIDKQTLISPFTLDHLFSDNLDFIERLFLSKNKVSDFSKCESACATSDAYKLKPFVENISIKDFDSSVYFKIINTGTIAKYYSKWGKKDMTYLKDKYTCPVVNKKLFLENFKNSYGKKAIEKKIVIKGLNLLDGCLDLNGDTIPAKTTLVITAKNERFLKFILGLINSQISLFYIKEKYPASSYNQGTTFTKDMINNLPLPLNLTDKDIDQVVYEVDQILNIVNHKEFEESKETLLDISLIAKKINDLFFELYKISDEERAIIKSIVK